MPIYEYRCVKCGRRFSHLHGVVAEPLPLECPRCHSTDLKRLISRVTTLRSEDDALDALDPSRFGDMEDPASMRKWARAMGKEMGDELGDDFEETLEEAMAAEESGEGEGGEGGEGPDAAPLPAGGADDF